MKHIDCLQLLVTAGWHWLVQYCCNCTWLRLLHGFHFSWRVLDFFLKISRFGNPWKNPWKLCIFS